MGFSRVINPHPLPLLADSPATKPLPAPSLFLGSTRTLRPTQTRSISSLHRPSAAAAAKVSDVKLKSTTNLNLGSFPSPKRDFRVFAMSAVANEASTFIPAAPIFLPEGPWKQIAGGVTAAEGFKAAGMYGGLRALGQKPDLALVTCDVDAVAAGTFTKNVVAAAPVLYCKSVLEKSKTARAVLINAGQANAATGDAGYQDVIDCSNALSKLLQVSPDEILIESTGVIGQRIKKEPLLNSLPKLISLLSTSVEGADAASVAITTTDLVSKSVAVEFETFRLDIHEQQIRHLPSDVTAIKDSLKALHNDRSASRVFQKFVFNWMHHQDSRSNSMSISHVPASSSGSISPPPSLIEQLEAIVSRSEERWRGHTVSRFSGLNSSSPTPIAQAPSSLEQFAEVESQFYGNSIDTGSLIEHAVDRSLDFQSRSLSPVAPLIAIISGSEEQSFGQGRLMSTRAKWVISDDVHWKLGSEPVVGHDGELKTVVDLDYPDLGQGVEQKQVVGLIFSDLDLCEKGNAPFDRGKSSLSHRPLIGTRLKFSATSHLWVVHGQPRPPEVVVGFQS